MLLRMILSLLATASILRAPALQQPVEDIVLRKPIRWRRRTHVDGAPHSGLTGIRTSAYFDSSWNPGDSVWR